MFPTRAAEIASRPSTGYHKRQGFDNGTELNAILEAVSSLFFLFLPVRPPCLTFQHNCSDNDVFWILLPQEVRCQFYSVNIYIRLRLNNHKAHARTLPNLPFSKHLSLPEHSFDKIRVTLLQSGFRSTREREQRKSYFIHKFETVTHGINENMGNLSFLRSCKS